MSTLTPTRRPAGDVAERFAALDDRLGTGEYNFEHFRTRHLLEDVQRTAEVAGVQPGEMAPDFELPQAGGGTVRLTGFRGRPVLVHFGSWS